MINALNCPITAVVDFFSRKRTKRFRIFCVLCEFSNWISVCKHSWKRTNLQAFADFRKCYSFIISTAQALLFTRPLRTFQTFCIHYWGARAVLYRCANFFLHIVQLTQRIPRHRISSCNYIALVALAECSIREAALQHFFFLIGNVVPILNSAFFAKAYNLRAIIKIL